MWAVMVDDGLKHRFAYIDRVGRLGTPFRNGYLVTENRMLRKQLKGRVRLSDGERPVLAAIGKRLGRQALEEVASIVKLDTILACPRKLVAESLASSRRPRVYATRSSMGE
jgi:hypothetical protein